MSLPLNWVVLFFFIIIAAVFLLVYEMQSKFKWKARSFKLEKENEKLKKQVSDPTNLKKEYNSIFNEIEKKLSQKQFQIFLYTIDGLSSKEIGGKINLSPATIDSHIKEIIISMGVEKRSQFASVLFYKLKPLLDEKILGEF